MLPFFGSFPFLTTDKIALVSAYVKCSRPNKFGKFAEDVETQSEDVRKDVGRKSQPIGNVYRTPSNLTEQPFHIPFGPGCEQGKEQAQEQQTATTCKGAIV